MSWLEDLQNTIGGWFGAYTPDPPTQQQPPAVYMPIAARPSAPSAPTYQAPPMSVQPRDSAPIYRTPQYTTPPPPSYAPQQQYNQVPVNMPLAPRGAPSYAAPFTYQEPQQQNVYVPLAPQGMQSYAAPFTMPEVVKPKTRSDWWVDPSTNKPQTQSLQPRIVNMGLTGSGQEAPPRQQQPLPWGVQPGPEAPNWFAPPDTVLGRAQRQAGATSSLGDAFQQTMASAVTDAAGNMIRNPSTMSVGGFFASLPSLVVAGAPKEPTMALLNAFTQGVEGTIGSIRNWLPSADEPQFNAPDPIGMLNPAKYKEDYSAAMSKFLEEGKAYDEKQRKDLASGKITPLEAALNIAPSIDQTSAKIQSQLGADYSKEYRDKYANAGMEGEDGLGKPLTNDYTPATYAAYQTRNIAFTGADKVTNALWRIQAGEDPTVVMRGTVAPKANAYRDQQEMYFKQVSEYVNGAERIAIAQARQQGLSAEQIASIGQDARIEAANLVNQTGGIPGEEDIAAEFFGQTLLSFGLSKPIKGVKAQVEAPPNTSFLRQWDAGAIGLDPTPQIFPIHKVFGVDKFLPRAHASLKADMLDQVYQPEMERLVEADLRGVSENRFAKAESAAMTVADPDTNLAEKGIAKAYLAYFDMTQRTEASRANIQAGHALGFMSRLVHGAENSDTVRQRISAMVMDPASLLQDAPELGNIPLSIRAKMAEPIITSDVFIKGLDKLDSMNQPDFNPLKFLAEADDLLQRASVAVNGVKPMAERPLIERIGSSVRSVMGEMYLRWPGYVIRNTIGDLVTMTTDGVMSFDSAREINQFMDRMGVSSPEIGGDLDAMGNPVGRRSMLEKVPVIGKPLAAVSNKVGDWNSRLDFDRRLRATYAGMRQFLDVNWKPQISDEARAILGPEVSAAFEANMRGALSTKELRDIARRHYDPKGAGDAFSASYHMQRAGVPLDSISPADMVNIEAGIRDLANRNAPPEERQAYFDQWKERLDKQWRNNVAKMGDVVNPRQATEATARGDIDEVQHNTTSLIKDMVAAGGMKPEEAIKNVDAAMRPLVEGEAVIAKGRESLGGKLAGLVDNPGADVNKVAALLNWAMNKEYELRGKYRQMQAELYKQTRAKLDTSRRGPTAAEAWAGQVWREYFDANRRNATQMHQDVANNYHWTASAVDTFLARPEAWDILTKEQPDLMSIEGYAQKLIDETRSQVDAQGIEGFNRMLASDRVRGDEARKELFRRSVVTLRAEPQIAADIFDVLQTAEKDVRMNAAKAAHEAEQLRAQMVERGVPWKDYYEQTGDIWRAHFDFAEQRNSTAMVQLSYAQARNSVEGRVLQGLGYSDKAIAEMFSRMDTADGQTAMQAAVAKARAVESQAQAAEAAKAPPDAVPLPSTRTPPATSLDNAPMSPARDRAETYLRSQFPDMPTDQFNAAMAVMDARAEMWARKNNASPDGWYSSRLATEGETGGDVLNQEAYHGGPHRFDKFSTDKINTGEGSQSYGWGLYFAGKKEVAEYYRTALTSNNYRNNVDSAYIYAAQSYVDSGLPVTVDELLKSYPKADRADLEYAIKVATKEIDGQLYKVEIPDDGAYLLWDKPLSEQPKIAQYKIDQLLNGDQAAKSLLSDRSINDYLGQAFYEILVQSRMDSGMSMRDAQQDVSMALKDAGIAGIKYLDGSSRDKGEGSYNYVVFDDKNVNIKETFYQGPRGSVEFLDDGRAVIKGLQSPDISTLMHEVGHVFRRDLEGDDLKIASEWAGAKLGDDGVHEWGRDAEEKFARGFEKYLQDGDAPTPTLRRVFDQFKTWLTTIYSKLRGVLPDTLPDEIRGVYDRLLAERIDQMKPPASAEEFARVRGVASLTPETAQTLLAEAMTAQDKVRGEADFGRMDQLKTAADALPDKMTVNRWLQPNGEPRKSIMRNGKREVFPNGWVDAQGGALDKTIDEALARFGGNEDRTGGAAQAWFDKLTEAKRVQSEMKALQKEGKRKYAKAAQSAENAMSGWQTIIDGLQSKLPQGDNLYKQAARDMLSQSGGDVDAAIDLLSATYGDQPEAFTQALDALQELTTKPQAPQAEASPVKQPIDQLVDAVKSLVDTLQPKPETPPAVVDATPQVPVRDQIRQIIQAAMRGEIKTDEARKQINALEPMLRELDPLEERAADSLRNALADGQPRNIQSTVRIGDRDLNTAELLPRIGAEQGGPSLWQVTPEQDRMLKAAYAKMMQQAETHPEIRPEVQRVQDLGNRIAEIQKAIDAEPDELKQRQLIAERTTLNNTRRRLLGLDKSSKNPIFFQDQVDPETLARYQDAEKEAGSHEQAIHFLDVNDAVHGAGRAAIDAIRAGLEDHLKTWQPGDKVYSGKERNVMQKELMRLMQEHTLVSSKAREYGTQMQRSSLLDYADRRNADTYLGLIAPFSYWGTRQGRNYALRMMANPAILTAYWRYRDMVEKENRKNRVRGRFGSGLKVPGIEPGGNQLYVDPVSSIFPFADMLRGDIVNDAGQAKTAMQTAYDALGMMGLRPSPVIDIPLRYSNLLLGKKPGDQGYGAENAEYGRGSIGEILPLNGIIQAATAAFGVGGPTGFDAEGRLRKMLGMHEGETWEAYRIARSVSDMAAQANQHGGEMDTRPYLIAQRFIDTNQNTLPTALREATAQQISDQFKVDPAIAAQALQIARQAAVRATGQRAYQQVASSFFGLRTQMLPAGERMRWEMKEYEKGAGYNPYTQTGSRAELNKVQDWFPALQVQRAQYGALPGDEKNYNYLYVIEEKKRLNAAFDRDLSNIIIQRPWDRDASKEIDSMRFNTLRQLDEMQGTVQTGDPKPGSIYGANPQEAAQIRQNDILRLVSKRAPKVEGFENYDDYKVARDAYRANVAAVAAGDPQTAAILKLADREGSGDSLRQFINGLSYSQVTAYKGKNDLPLEAMQQAYFEKVYEPAILDYNRQLVRGDPRQAWDNTIGRVGGMGANELMALVKEAYPGRWTDAELSQGIAGAQMPMLAEMIKQKYNVAADGGFKYRQDYLYGAKNIDPQIEFWRWYRNEIPPGRAANPLRDIPQIGMALDPAAAASMTPEQWNTALTLGRAWMASEFPDASPEARVEWAQAKDESKQLNTLLMAEYGKEGQGLLDMYFNAPDAKTKAMLRERYPLLDNILDMRKTYAEKKGIYDAYYGPGSYGTKKDKNGKYPSGGKGGRSSGRARYSRGRSSSRRSGGGSRRSSSPRFNWSFARGYSGPVIKPRAPSSGLGPIQPPKLAPRKVKMNPLRG